MAQRSVQVIIATGGWKNLYAIIKTALGITDDRELPACGQSGSIYNNYGATVADCRLEITSDPINHAPFSRLLPEDTYPFRNTSGANKNSVSLQDKWVRMVDNAGVQIAGTGVVTIDYA